MKRNRESGVTILLVALGLTMLLGAVGLGVDMGYLRYERRLQQAGADAAAIAGASDLATNYGGHTGALAAAVTAASANGYTVASTSSGCPAPTPTGAVGTVVLTVNNPPCSGPHNGDAAYVETYVGVVQSTFFMKIFGTTSEPVVTRAVATNVGGGKGSGCLFTLGSPTDGIEGVNVNGNVTVNAQTCGIVDNGNFNTQGNALTFNSGTFGIAGDYNHAGGGGTVTCAGSAACPTTTNMPPAGDPLAGLVTAPTVGAPAAFNAASIVPGSTFNGISIPANTTVTFPAGTYVVTGGNFTIPGNSTVLGTGVTFYFTNGSTITATGTPDIQLSAPNSGTYAGILFYQDPADTNVNGPALGGDSNSFFQGALYFPNDQLTFFGNDSFNSGAAYTMVIAKSLSFSGHPDVTLNSNYGGLPNGLSIIKNAVLVE